MASTNRADTRTAPRIQRDLPAVPAAANGVGPGRRRGWAVEVLRGDRPDAPDGPRAGSEEACTQPRPPGLPAGGGPTRARADDRGAAEEAAGFAGGAGGCGPRTDARHDRKPGRLRLRTRTKRRRIAGAMNRATRPRRVRRASFWRLALMLGLLLHSVATAAFNLTPEEQAWLQDHPEIRVGINNAWPPMDYLDLQGMPRGIGVRLIRSLNKRLGGRLERVPGAWKEIYDEAREHRLDALLDITPLPERAAEFNFTTPYVRIPHVIFVHDDAPPVRSLDDLAGKTVAVEEGFFLAYLLRERYPEITVRTYPDTSSALGAVARHEADAYVGNRAAAMRIMREELLSGLRAAARVRTTQSVIAIGVRKDWPVLRDILQKALDDIGDDERAAILDLDRLSPTGHARTRDFLESLPTADRRWLIEHSPIMVGVMDSWPPFSFLDENGKHVGVSAGYLQALNERLGNALIPVPGEWDRIYHDVAGKRLDAIMDITPKPSREGLFHFTTPYLKTPHVIVARREEPFLASESDLIGKRLALERGFGNVEYFRKNYPGVELKLYSDTMSALEAVSRGEADAYAGNRAVALYLIGERLLSNLRIHGELSKPPSLLTLGVRKDWPKLRDILQRALDDISTAERRRIVERWVYGNDDAAPTLELTEAQREWLNRHPEIPVGIDGNWPPIDFLDDQGRHVGITADYLRLLEKRLGVRFVPKKFGSFDEMLKRVKKGDPPVAATVAYSRERARRLLYTESFFDAHEVIMVRDENRHLRHIEDLVGHTVAAEKGFITTAKLRKNYPGIKLILVDSTLDALRKVSWGGADAYIGNQAVATWLKRTHQLDNLVVTGDAGLGVDPQHFVVSRRAPEWTPLVDILNTALASVSEAERLQIEQRWLGESSGSGLPQVKLTEEERRWLQEHKSIRLGVDRAWPPMEFIDENGEYKGISHDYIQLFGHQLGIHWIAPESLPWVAVLRGIREKTLDVIPLLAPNAERRAYMNFTKPYFKARAVIFTRRGQGSLDLNGLNGRRVAVVRSYWASADLRRDYPGIVQVPYETVGEALHSVLEGHTDAYVGLLPVASYIIGKEGLTGLQIAGVTQYVKSFSVGVRKDWPELVTLLNKAIDTLDEATHNQIIQRWTTVELKQKTDYTLVLRILIVLLLVVLFGAIWIRQIQRANRALDESRKRLALVLKSGQLGAWEAWLDHENQLRLQIDPTGFELLCLETKDEEVPEDEWRMVEVPLQDYFAAVHEEDRESLQRRIQEYLSGTDPVFNHEYRPHACDRWLYARGYALDRDPEGKPRRIVGIAMDITERKRAQEALERASQFKSEFLANMSHEIRTPMNAVVGLAHLLTKTELTPQQKDYVRKIQISAKSLLGVIDDILDFSKIEAGKLSIENRPFDFDDILENISVLAQTRIGEKPVEFLFELSPEIPKRLIGDAYRINQVLTNLVANAIKFTEQGTIVLAARVKEKAGQEVRLEIEVRDTGIGIPQDKIAGLFDPFVQADGSTTRRFGGTGLGLSIAQKLCALMGGRIGIESREGVGSVFRVELPLKVAESGRLLEPLPDLRGQRVLLVEDSPTAQQVIGDLLESLTHEVTVVPTGAEALARLDDPNGRFDLVFIDWRLPDMDGDEVARRLHEKYGERRPAVILITAFGREIASHPLDQNHIDALLIKPLTPSMVNDAIMEAYGIHRPAGFEAEPRAGETRFSGRVLLAEDNAINRQVAVELLQHMGVDVVTVSDGASAVQAVKRERPDLVFLDIQMPVMDGYEAARRIRALPGADDLPIYAMTANALVGDAEKSLAAGMNGHIPKPIDPEKLVEVLARHLSVQTDAEAPTDGDRSEDGVAISNPSPETIDVQRGIKMVGGSSRFYLRLLRDFLERHGEGANTMEQLLNSSRLEEAAREAHTLKGVAGNIGATKLQRQAAELEEALRRGEPSAQQVERFIEAAQELFSAVREITDAAHAAGTGGATPERAASEPRRETIENLIDSLQKGEARAIKLYRELRDHIEQRLDPADSRALQSLIEDYAFESAAELLQRNVNGQDGRRKRDHPDRG